MRTNERKNFGHWLFQAFFMSMLCLLSACSDDNSSEVSNIPKDWIQGLPENISFKVGGGEQTIAITLGEGVDASKIEYIMSENADSWCKVSIGNDNIKIEATPYGYSREAYLTLIYDKDHKKSMKVMQITDFSDYFKDDICSELKSGITKEEINGIPNPVIKQLAIDIYNSNYDKEFRVASYRPYQHPEVMAKRNKTNKYSLRDNPTGIWAEQGDEIYVMVGDIYEEGKLELMFHGLDKGYSNSKNVPIVKGLNKLIAPITGQIYVMNHVQDEIPLLLKTDEAKAMAATKTVNIHFINGRQNGYIDITKHTTNEMMREVLNKTQYGFIDLVGNYAHLSWRVDQFKEHNTNLLELITNLDNLVYWEEEFAGLVKYNRMFNNRQYLTADKNAKSPNASDYRTVYPTGGDTEYWSNIFYDNDVYKTRLWGPAHEVGHTNQLRPGVKWVGMTEVTNNIYCLYVQEKENQPCKLQNDQITCKDEKGNSLGKKIIYDAAIEFIVEGKRAHCLPNIKDIVRESQLVPFWQLKLYMVDVLGQKDFYKDLYEYLRNNPSPSEKGESKGLDQLDFVRQSCKIANLDLTDFFDKWGFLTPVNTVLDDYGSKSFVITQKEIDALKEEIKNAGYPKPKHNNIHLITNNTLENYKSQN